MMLTLLYSYLSTGFLCRCSRQDPGPGRARRQWYVLLPPSLPPSLSRPPSLPPSPSAGKSTLLLAMLGELGVYDRSVVDIGDGPLAYASQEVSKEGGREGGREG